MSATDEEMHNADEWVWCASQRRRSSLTYHSLGIDHVSYALFVCLLSCAD